MTAGDKAAESRRSGGGTTRGQHPLLEYFDSALRGCGQVIFMDNPLTGALNLAAMFWGAFAGGTTYAAATGSLMGVLAATAAAYALGVNHKGLRAGLYGFNGMLTGAGVATFLGNTPLMWAVLLFAAAVSTVVTLAVEGFLETWETPGLTFPFVLTTWLFLLAAYRFAGAEMHGMPVAALATGASVSGGAFGLAEFVRASLASVSQVFFVDDPISGAIFLTALAVHSRWCAGLAALGAMAGVVSALLLGADREAVSQGLWGYSAVLTAPAIGCVFLKPDRFALAYSAAATLFTVFVQGAVSVLAQTAGLPALTFPFVLATWIFLAARRMFEPGRARGSGGAV